MNTNRKHANPLKVLVYPYASNPYQKLLESAFSKGLVTTMFMPGPGTISAGVMHFFQIASVLIRYRFRGYKLLHLHWLYPLDFPGKKYAPRICQAVSTLQVVLFLFLLRTLRYKLVWTVHDIVPHDKHTLNDVMITQRILEQADQLIILSKSTLKQAAELNIKFPLEKTTIIPHGNYVESNPNTISPVKARKLLDIPTEAFVVLFFGRIEPYKNIPALLSVMNVIMKQHSNTMLVVAGKSHIPDLNRLLNKAAASNRVRVFPNFIPDSEVQNFYNCADVVVCPFQEITNSGSVILAASFGKPVIAPLIGAIKDLPFGMGIFYDPKKSNSLALSIEFAITNRKKLNLMSKEANSYANSLSWKTLAAQTYGVYEKALKDDVG